jgi:hypothetical protein
MHNMNGHAVNLDAQVSQLVETSLQGERVEGPPVRDQFSEPAPGRTARPRAAGIRRQPGRAQPSAKVLKGHAIEDNPDWLSVQRVGHAEIMAGRTRAPARQLSKS